MKTSSTPERTPWLIGDQDDGTRLLPRASTAGALLEMVTIVRDDGTELAIHTMEMRPRYRRLLPGE